MKERRSSTRPDHKTLASSARTFRGLYEGEAPPQFRMRERRTDPLATSTSLHVILAYILALALSRCASPDPTVRIAARMHFVRS